MRELSEQLIQVVEAAEPRLRAMSELEIVKPLLQGGWSSKQVLGHLIDSASNNHQRLVRAALQPSLDFPGYEQDGCVEIQGYQDADWQSLVELWAAYNSHIAHVIARLPESKSDTLCRIGGAEPVTFEFLVSDYVVHLAHHLRQLGATG